MEYIFNIHILVPIAINYEKRQFKGGHKISRGIGLRKLGKDFWKHVGIIIDLEGFPLMSKSRVSSTMSLRMLIRPLIEFLK